MQPTTIVKLVALVCLFFQAAMGCGDDQVKRGCREGLVLDAEGGVCVEPASTCAAGSDGGSLLSTCSELHRACVDGDAGARCGACIDGFAQEGTGCVAVDTCADLACEMKNRSCSPEGAHTGASCGDCAEGLLDIDGTCARLNCNGSGVLGSLTDECTKQSRVCTASNGGAMCTGCAAGFVEEGGACIQALDCQALACAAAGRDCEKGKPGAHARCSSCLPGYRQLAGTCVRDKDTKCDGVSNAVVNIEDDCLKRHRFCVSATAGGAQCGQCAADHVELPDGSCVREGSCDSLDCTKQLRACVESPTGLCTTCLPGYLEDGKTGACRETKKCADITCAAREQCQEASSYADAECHGSCGQRAIWNGRRCEPCPACTASGERGRWPWPTAEGNCICETEPGYYYSIAGDVGPFQCDGDKDGWVRESARIGLESTDPSIRENARCELRSIDRVVLENQFGQSRMERFKAPLSLYETDRNDDDRILSAYWTALNLPPYGGGQQLTPAAQLNRFTKYCGSRLADYNDNGTPDVGEWAAGPRGPLMRPEQGPFNTFSFFAELHTSAYEKAGSGAGPGAYRIRERSRLTAADAAGKATTPMGYGAATDAAWRTCRVLRDAEHQLQDPAIGMDFSLYYEAAAGSASPWDGMVHHSQFKCVVIEADPDPIAPQEKSLAELSAAQHVLSRCELQKKDSHAVEPVCNAIATTSARLGEALWASVAYRHHEGFPVDDNGDNKVDCLALDPLAKDCSGPKRAPGSTPWVYEHGCVNECVEGVHDCPGYALNASAVSCSPGTFGEKTSASCDVWELCDGRDNDEDSRTDDIINETTKQRDESLLSRDPRVGVNVSCDVSGAFGICKPGRMQCVRSVDNPPTVTAAPACVFVIQPGSRLETCDGADQDCDNKVDESFVDSVTFQAQEGRPCSAPGLKGECAKGVYKCQANSQGVKTVICEPPVYAPIAEICNGLDDDCNGLNDDAPNTVVATQGCPATFTQYFRDGDRDNYVSPTDAKCACAAPAGYRVKVGGFDCCDTDSGTYPGEPNWKSSKNACGHWDWDCSDANRAGEPRYSALGTNSGCAYDAGKVRCNGGGAGGWETAVAGCGAQGNYFGSCNYRVGAGCDRHTSQLWQECK